ncbi:MAG TPA: glucosidase, partial [Armatimonadota bacterium]|nr:glucosidase [Armatimonadota bacterium]
MPRPQRLDPESRRLAESDARQRDWKRWGPYLPERQWGTVREDYSATGSCWDYFPHDHARSRAYRWGEDGLLGLCDRQALLCFAPALWNGRDPILKERLFGLTHDEGNHGEDVKECYFYQDGTPTHSYMRALYRYPHAAFPYSRLVYENGCRGLEDLEFELPDTGVFDEDRYFDLVVEYAKAGPDDLLIRLTVANRGPEAASLHVLGQLWFRNTWAWGCPREGRWGRPEIIASGGGILRAEHAALGTFLFAADSLRDGAPPQLLFTENETNWARLNRGSNAAPWVKDAFHEYIVNSRRDAVNPERRGTKAAALYPLQIPPGEERVLRFRLYPKNATLREPLGPEFDRTFAQRREEADRFYAERLPASLSDEERRVARQALAGLLWSKQFYCYSVREWLDGDPCQPPPPPGRTRNREWRHLHNEAVVSVPDRWEYPWYAAWDLAFHMVPYAHLDTAFAKEQLLLLLDDRYLHPNGQLPAYEFAFGDVNPPVHAWAALRVYRVDAERRAKPDTAFLTRAFQRLLINFTWWVNQG